LEDYRMRTHWGKIRPGYHEIENRDLPFGRFPRGSGALSYEEDNFT
jgi:hypothetical protein